MGIIIRGVLSATKYGRKERKYIVYIYICVYIYRLSLYSPLSSSSIYYLFSYFPDPLFSFCFPEETHARGTHIEGV